MRYIVSNTAYMAVRQRMSCVLVGLLILVCSIPISAATVIKLRLPALTDSPQLHVYFRDLISTALQNIGYTVEIDVVKAPQTRIVRMLEEGEISLFWLVASEEREQKFESIPVGLTNGLIGHRILLIRPEDQAILSRINRLQDLQASSLVAGLGKNWFDVQVWRLNNLPYHEHEGEWRTIFNMLRYRRVYDYFPRGMNEVLHEQQEHPYLAVEQSLVLVYDRDIRYYLSRSGRYAGVVHQSPIEQAIRHAAESGLIDRLVDQYWGNDLIKLNYTQRKKIHLKTP